MTPSRDWLRLHAQVDRFLTAVYAERARPGWHTMLTLTVRLGLVLFVYLCLDLALFWGLRLPETSYFQPVILWETLRHLGLLGVILLTLTVIVLWRSFNFWCRWTHLQDGDLLRPLVTLIALMLGWWYTTYDYNFYFDQGHYLDRLLLTAFSVLIYWRPAFTFPFLLLLTPIMGQFDYPIGGYSLAQPLLPLHIVMLFAAWFLVSLLSRRQKSSDFVFLSLCLIATSYLAPGLGKIQLNWITHGHLFLLLFATYANGWLAFLRPEQLLPLARGAAVLDPLMVFFTLFAEVGSILVLWRRKTAVLWLAAWILLHIGVFILSGIFFWTWILTDAAFLILIWHVSWRTDRQPPILSFFTRPHFLTSLLIIGGGLIFFRPVNLSWYDSPLSYTYLFHGVGESGRLYHLSPDFFSPYDYQFTLSNFSYLTEEPRLPIVWGAVRNRTYLNGLMAADTADDLWALEETYGTNRFNPKSARALDQFVNAFVSHVNQKREMRFLLGLVQAPDQLWTFAGQDAYAYQEPLRLVCITERTSFYDGQHYTEIRHRPTHQIPINTTAAESPTGRFGSVCRTLAD